MSEQDDFAAELRAMVPDRVPAGVELPENLAELYRPDGAGGFALSPVGLAARDSFEQDMERDRTAIKAKDELIKRREDQLERIVKSAAITGALLSAGAKPDLLDLAHKHLMETLTVKISADVPIALTPFGRCSVPDAVAQFLKSEAGIPYAGPKPEAREPGPYSEALRGIRRNGKAH